MNVWRSKTFSKRSLRSWIIVIQLVVTVGCERQQSRTDPPQSPIVCDVAYVDLGETPVLHHAHDFRIKNTGSRTVKITALGKSCNCVSLTLDKDTLLPGEEATIGADLNVNPMMKGTTARFSEEIFVHLDGEKDPSLTLALGGTYVPPVYMLGTRLRIPVNPRIDLSFSSTVDLFIQNPDTTKIEGLEVSGPPWLQAVRSDYQASSRDNEIKCPLRIHGKLPEGVTLPAIATIRVTTNVKGASIFEVPVTIFHETVDVVACDSERITFGVITGRQMSKRAKDINLTVKGQLSQTPQLSITDTRNGALLVSVGDLRSEAGATKLRIHCELDPSKLQGAISEIVTCGFDIGGARQIVDLPVTGFVAIDSNQ